jgi:hypothetical protein
LIQAGASLAYVRDQLGHSSIQVTVDLYGHLVPSANVGWVDGLDSAEPEEQSATPTQQETEEESDESFEVIENYGSPGVSRTRDLRFRKSHASIENKADQQDPPADSGKALQNPQPPRNKTDHERSSPWRKR